MQANFLEFRLKFKFYLFPAQTKLYSLQTSIAQAIVFRPLVSFYNLDARHVFFTNKKDPL